MLYLDDFSQLGKGWCILRAHFLGRIKHFLDPIRTSESQLQTSPACRNLNDRLIVLLRKLSKG